MILKQELMILTIKNSKMLKKANYLTISLLGHFKDIYPKSPVIARINVNYYNNSFNCKEARYSLYSQIVKNGK